MSRPALQIHPSAQVLGKDAVRAKVITDAEKRRITIEVRAAHSVSLLYAAAAAAAASAAASAAADDDADADAVIGVDFDCVGFDCRF